MTAREANEFCMLMYMLCYIYGVLFLFTLAYLAKHKDCRITSTLSFLIERLKVNSLLSSSGYKSCLEVGKFVGVVKIPYEAGIFDIAGATVQGDSLQFNDGATEVSYKVSMPNGASVRRTKRGRISLKKHGAVYTLKRSGYKCASMFSFAVYSLDSRLRWYLDGGEIEFPKGGNASLVTAPVGHMLRLFGYDSENRFCDGLIVRVV